MSDPTIVLNRLLLSQVDFLSVRCIFWQLFFDVDPWLFFSLVGPWWCLIAIPRLLINFIYLRARLMLHSAHSRNIFSNYIFFVSVLFLLRWLILIELLNRFYINKNPLRTLFGSILVQLELLKYPMAFLPTHSNRHTKWAFPWALPCRIWILLLFHLTLKIPLIGQLIHLPSLLQYNLVELVHGFLGLKCTFQGIRPWLHRLGPIEAGSLPVSHVSFSPEFFVDVWQLYIFGGLENGVATG